MTQITVNQFLSNLTFPQGNCHSVSVEPRESVMAWHDVRHVEKIHEFSLHV